MSAETDDFDYVLLEAMKTKIETIRTRRTRTVPMWWDRGTITVRMHQPLPEVMALLTRENLFGVPVVGEDGQFIDFIELNDIVQYTVSLFDAPSTTELREFFDKRGQFQKSLVQDLLTGQRVTEMEFDGRERHLTVERGFSVHHALELLARCSKHRIAAVDEQGQIRAVITQSMMVGWMRDHLDLFGRAKSIPVRRLNSTYYVASIRQDEKAIHAFKLMANQRVSGLAVVNEFGILVDSITVQDLRGIGAEAEMFMILWDTVQKFKEYQRKHVVYGLSVPKEPVCVVASDTLEKVVTLMDRERTHIVFVVPSLADKRPINVVSQTDVIRAIVPRTSWRSW